MGELIALYIIGGILLLLTLILFLRAELVISYSDIFALDLYVHGIRIHILPAREKKIRLSDYNARGRKKHEKNLKKAAARAADKEKKKAKRKADTGSGNKKRSLHDNISLITNLCRVAIGRFGRHLRIRIARLHIAVATGDAASTAILYGVIAQSVAYLAALLNSVSTLRFPERADVDVHADYLSEKISVDIKIGFSLCLWQALDILLRSGIAFIKHV